MNTNSHPLILAAAVSAALLSSAPALATPPDPCAARCVQFGVAVAVNPQPLPPGHHTVRFLNPQPLPPGHHTVR